MIHGRVIIIELLRHQKRVKVSGLSAPSHRTSHRSRCPLTGETSKFSLEWSLRFASSRANRLLRAVIFPISAPRASDSSCEAGAVVTAPAPPPPVLLAVEGSPAIDALVSVILAGGANSAIVAQFSAMLDNTSAWPSQRSNAASSLPARRRQ